MGRYSLEELKEIYKAEWEEACKRFQSEAARRKAFRALINFKKAKLEDYIEKEKERRRRTRALILFSSSLIRKLDSEELKQLLELMRSELFAKEGKQTVDYLPFLLQEIKEHHPNFDFEPEEPETEPEEKNETEEAVAGNREDLKKQLQVKFEEAAQKAFQN